MSKATEKYLEQIQQVLNCEANEAAVVFEVIEDYFDPDWSEMTNAEFVTTIHAAHDLMPEVL
jgi:hypothetical protein